MFFYWATPARTRCLSQHALQHTVYTMSEATGFKNDSAIGMAAQSLPVSSSTVVTKRNKWVTAFNCTFIGIGIFTAACYLNECRGKTIIGKKDVGLMEYLIYKTIAYILFISHCWLASGVLVALTLFKTSKLNTRVLLGLSVFSFIHWGVAICWYIVNFTSDGVGFEIKPILRTLITSLVTCWTLFSMYAVTKKPSYAHKVLPQYEVEAELGGNTV